MLTTSQQDAVAIDSDAVGALGAGIRRLAMQRELLGMAAVAAETAAELALGLRARCYFFHAEESRLWTEEGAEIPATAGLAGLAARSGRACMAQRAQLDPDYRREVDDPDGNGTERIVAQPIVTSGGETHAIVVVARSSSLPAFTASELALLAAWAEQAAPLFHMLHLEGLAQQAQLDAEVAGRRSIYREEALERLAAGEEDHGVLLERLPWWLYRSHWLGVAVVLAAVLFVSLVRVGEQASGPAFIVSTAHRDVATTRGGVIESVLVAPGDAVEAQQLLATFSAQPEQAEQARAQADLERALLARLRTPSDRALEAEVAQARASLRRAAARVEEACLRAASAGRVGDIRIEPGRAVEPGQVVMTISDDEASQPVVRALVPGRHRPAVAVGQPFTLVLDGFSDAAQRITVSSVSEEVLGIGEMQRVVGPKLADALAIQGPVIIVEARLPGSTIEADGRSFTLHEGMVGRADVAVRRKPIVFLLFPALERMLGDA